MPSRMIDYDALWTSDKLAACKEAVRVEYVWLYGLADANGCFEINIRSIHSRVSSIRPKLSMNRIKAILEEFHQKGLLFIWKADKTYGFWTGSNKKGRLPKESERHRYKRFAPDVPTEALAEYESRFSRDVGATISPLGAGVGLGVGLDRKGSGLGEGEGGGAEGEALLESGGGTAHEAKPALGQSPRAPVKDQFPVEKKTNGKGKTNYCEFCVQQFSNLDEFLGHKCRAKTGSGYECVDCHLPVKSLRELREHRVRPCVAATASTDPRQ